MSRDSSEYASPGNPPDVAPPAHPPSTATRNWSKWDLVWLVLATLVAIFTLSVVVGLFRPTGAAEIIALTTATQVSFGGAAVILIAARAGRWDAVGVVRCGPGAVIKAALVTLPLIPLAGLTGLGVRWLLGEPLDPPQEDLLGLHLMDAPDLAVMMLMVTVAAPLAEELYFRGIVLDALQERFGAGWGIAGSSLAFGLVHVEPSLIVSTTLLGAAFAVARLKTGSLWPAVAMHATNNAVAAVVLTLEIA